MNTRKFLSLCAAILIASASFASCLGSETPAGPGDDSPSPNGLAAEPPSGGVGDVVSQTDDHTLPDDVEIVTPVVPPSESDGSADFYPDGIFIYGDAVYTQSYFYEQYAQIYAQTAQYYKQLFGCRVSAVISPLSSMTIDNPKITAAIPSQKDILDQMAPLFGPAVNFVNPYEKLEAHKSEYLFFRTDHHWTQRGAYYAYAAFAESVGFTPTPLEIFTSTVLNDHYAGAMYDWTKDERVRGFGDQVEAFFPTKPVSMTVETSWGETLTFDTCIVEKLASGEGSYISFIYGDNPYTVINVPDNPQDLVCLVMKDSFGNAFVPFLCEHYGTVVVVDPRYYDGVVTDRLWNMGLTDILFVNNAEAANSIDWPRLYMACVGVTLP